MSMQQLTAEGAQKGERICANTQASQTDTIQQKGPAPRSFLSGSHLAKQLTPLHKQAG